MASVIPKSIQYALKGRLVDARTIERQVMPMASTVFSPNGTNVITFNLPMTDFLNGGLTYLRYTFHNANATAQHLNSVCGHNCIRQVRILANGQTIEEINNWNALVGSMIKLSPTSYRDSDLNVMNGTGAAATGEEVAATGNRTFSFPLWCLSFFNSQKLIPLALMTNTQIQVELTLETVDRAVEHPPTNAIPPVAVDANWTINNPVLSCQYVQVPQDLMQTIRGALNAAGSLSVFGQTYINRVSQLPGSTIPGSSADIVLPVSANSVKSIFHIQRKDSRMNSVTLSKINAFDRNGLTEFQHVHNGAVLSHPFRCNVEHQSEAFCELLSSAGMLTDKLNATSITRNTYAGGDNFFIGQNVEAFSFDGETGTSGLDLASSRTPLMLKLSYGEARDACSIDSFFLCDHELRVYADGSVKAFY